MRLPLVVLDTNVVVSALLFAQGRLAPLRAAWQQRRCEPCVSKVTTEELLRVLAYPKFALTADEQAELLADYLPYCKTVRLPAKPQAKVPACRDPFDRSFLLLAVTAKADFLVTGDRDLLVLAQATPCSIVTPEEFLRGIGP